MKSLVGEKSVFALECLVSDKDPNMGRIFMYVKGVKFGQDDFDEELDSFFFRAIKSIKCMSHDYPDLFLLSVNEYFQLIDCIYEDFDSCDCDLFKKFEARGSEIDWNTILRAEYAFDDLLIGVVSSDNEDKIFMRESDTLAECILEKGIFENSFIQLALSVIPDYDFYDIGCDSTGLTRRI